MERLKEGMVRKINRKRVGMKRIGQGKNEKWKSVKAEVSTSFIVGIILVLFGLAILLLFYYQLAWTGEVDREVCHQSVIYRATLPSLAKSYVPLKCPTQKICVTGKNFGKGDCEEFKNEKYVVTARISNLEQGLNQLQKIYAEEILSCWSMMGEGKVSLYSEGTGTAFGFGKVYPSCVVCSRIAIDKNSLDNVALAKMDLEDYMLRHVAPGSEKSYFDIILGEDYSSGVDVENLKSAPIIDGESNEEIKNEDKNDLNVEPLMPVENEDVLRKETAVIFSQISSPSFSSTYLKDLGVLTGGAYLAPKFVSRAVLSGPGLVITSIFLIAQSGSIVYNKAVTAGYCGQFETSVDSRQGCSAVRTLEYSPETILKHCGVIESIP